MDKLIYIENNNLLNYVLFKLDKLDNGFEEQELEKISEVVIDYNDEDDINSLLNELLKLKYLNAITFRNGYIFNNDFKDILSSFKYLNDVTFDNCEFEDFNYISSLKINSLSLYNCNISNYSFISKLLELTSLTIVNGSIEMNKINMLNNLEYLKISYSLIEDNIELNLTNISELYIDNTNINKFDFLLDFKNLKKLSIDEKQFNSNKQLFNDLKNNNILVLNEGIVEFGGDNNGI